CTTTSGPLIPAQEGVTIPPTPTTPQPQMPPSGGAGVTEYPPRNGSTGLPFERNYPQTDTAPKTDGSSYRQLPPKGTTPLRQTLPAPPNPKVKLNQIASIPGGQIEGQVVRSDNSPWAGARVMFVCVDRHEPRKTTYTDATGKFQVALPA